jgi:arylsulfatase A-like enzyme/tetratricopeptide (TPR) repeat protein
VDAPLSKAHHSAVHRERFLFALLLLLVLPACTKPGAKVADASRSRGASVVLVSIDTLRSDHLPLYGARGLATPTLDALAADGVVFERAYSPCPLTLPAHTSIFTGLDPAAHGVRNNVGFTLDASKHPTLASLLKARGYKTGGAVSAFVLRGATGLASAFDFYDDRIEAPADTSAAGAVQRAGPETMRRGLAWLDSLASGPFFLFVHLYEPHTPYDPPEPFRSRSASAYDGEIAFADSIVGTLVADLKRRALYDATLFVVLSDHGEGLGDHGEQEHGILLYREALQVPLVVKLPGSRRRGTRVTEPVGLVDVLPTLAGELGLSPPRGLPGIDLLADASRPRAEERRIFSETMYPRIHLGWSELRSLVGKRDHFIEGVRAELYDVVSDPGETRDLFASSGDTARDFKRALNRIEAPYTAPGQVASEDLKKLASLGYLTGASGGTGPLPDPRASLPILEDMKKAFTLGAKGHDAEALAGLRSVLARQPGLFDAQYAEAEVLARMGRLEESAAAYAKALRLSPALASPIALALARVTLELSRPDEAEANARIALRESPDEAHEILARVALERNDLEGAEREARLVHGGVSLEARGAVVLAEVALRHDRPADALALLDAARRPVLAAGLSLPRNLSFLTGDALARSSRLPEAATAFREEIRAYPTNAQAYARLAIVLAVEHQTRGEVTALLESMYRANPSPATARLAQKTLDSIGDGTGAARWVARGRSPSARPSGASR